MTEEQKKETLKKFASDLGIALGASKDTALQKGMQVLQKLDQKVAQNLMATWQNAEKTEQGSGPKALQQTIQKMQQTSQEEPEEEDDQIDMARLGTKFNYIRTLNGHCPEGYEVVKYAKGGCVKCQKGKKLHMLNLINSQPIEKRIQGFRDGGAPLIERFRRPANDMQKEHIQYNQDGVGSAWATVGPKQDTAFYYWPTHTDSLAEYDNQEAKDRFYKMQKNFILQQHLQRLKNRIQVPLINLKSPEAHGVPFVKVADLEQKD